MFSQSVVASDEGSGQPLSYEVGAPFYSDPDVFDMDILKPIHME